MSHENIITTSPFNKLKAAFRINLLFDNLWFQKLQFYNPVPYDTSVIARNQIWIMLCNGLTTGQQGCA